MVKKLKKKAPLVLADCQLSDDSDSGSDHSYEIARRKRKEISAEDRIKKRRLQLAKATAKYRLKLQTKPEFAVQLAGKKRQKLNQLAKKYGDWALLVPA